MSQLGITSLIICTFVFLLFTIYVIWERLEVYNIIDKNKTRRGPRGPPGPMGIEGQKGPRGLVGHKGFQGGRGSMEEEMKKKKQRMVSQECPINKQEGQIQPNPSIHQHNQDSDFSNTKIYIFLYFELFHSFSLVYNFYKLCLFTKNIIVGAVT